MVGWTDDDLRRASGLQAATPESENLADKVLAIDDDRSLHHLVGKGFEGSEVEVIAAKDGRAGLESVERDRPDVVLLDIRLPDASGLELFRDIQTRDRRLPVVFITADSESETAINAIQLGAFDYLRKPLDLAELKEVVLRALDTRRLMNIPVAVPIRGDHQAGGDPGVDGIPDQAESPNLSGLDGPGPGPFERVLEGSGGGADPIGTAGPKRPDRQRCQDHKDADGDQHLDQRERRTETGHSGPGTTANRLPALEKVMLSQSMPHVGNPTADGW